MYIVRCALCILMVEKFIHTKKTVSTGNLLAHLREEHNIKSTLLSNERINIRRFFEPHKQFQQSSKFLKINNKKRTN